MTAGLSLGTGRWDATEQQREERAGFDLLYVVTTAGKMLSGCNVKGSIKLTDNFNFVA